MNFLSRRSFLMAAAASPVALEAANPLASLSIGVTDWNLRKTGNTEAVALAKSEVERNLALARTQEQEHFEKLNGETARMDKLHAQMISVDRFEGVEKRVAMLERNESESRGRMWLPMIAAAGLAAGLTAAVVKLLIP